MKAGERSTCNAGWLLHGNRSLLEAIRVSVCVSTDSIIGHTGCDPETGHPCQNIPDSLSYEFKTYKNKSSLRVNKYTIITGHFFSYSHITGAQKERERERKKKTKLANKIHIITEKKNLHP